MPFVPPANAPRCAVVDLGSNSVRLVVYEGACRNPVPIFNEKAVLRLGKGLQATGRLNQEGVTQALTVLHRYHAVARAMGADPLEVLGTAAVRDASNGAAFIEQLQARLPGVPIRILSGPEEAEYSALGVLCGIPDADGLLADIGGGSLELVRLAAGQPGGEAQTLGLGVIRLTERAGGDLARARAIADGDLAAVPWLRDVAGRDLYLVGGAWRAVARLHMAQTAYPLHMVHQYEVPIEEARELAGMIAGAGRRLLERLPGVPRKRIDDLPFAAVVLRRVLRASGVRRVVFSASGLREGWFMRHMPPEIREQDPLIAAGQDYARRLGRDPAFPPLLITWTAPLVAYETPEARRLREALCWMSDLGSRDHPEFRAEQAFWRVLRDGRDAITEVPRERWDIDAFYDADPEAVGKMVTRWGGFVSDVAEFDAPFFSISPREAMSMDPQQRLLLEVAWEALEDGGQAVEKLVGSKSGVFIGIGTNDYARLIERSRPRAQL